MQFDFDNFTRRVELAYRHFENHPYSINEVLEVFRCYFETYEFVFHRDHPMISVIQIRKIIKSMPILLGDGKMPSREIMYFEYEPIVEQHFVTEYLDCDYNIVHFFSK